MLRIAAVLMIASAAPAIAATAASSLQVGIVIVASATGLKTTRVASRSKLAQAPPRIFVTCDAGACVKTIYY